MTRAPHPEHRDGPAGDQVALPPEAPDAPPPASNQVAQVVQYALANLGARNAHHTFEEICRHFAQQRIAANILPATGPVAAGGDQGRDFETFRSYLRDELGPHGAFLGHVSDGALVFTCTLQQEGTEAKVLSDVQKVVAGGRCPAGIYAFCAANVPVARRHRLEARVAQRFEGQFELIDLQTLSEQLATSDLFWVAEQFLQLPAALAPPRPEQEIPLPEWYVEDRARWRERDTARPTTGDILDLKDGLRQATRFAEARADLPFWLTLARSVAGDDAPVAVRHRARYEVAWATFQAQGDMRPVDDLVRAFFADLLASEELEPARLADAGVVLTISTTALRVGRTTLAPSDIRLWNDTLRRRLRAELAETLLPTRKAELLDLLGHLALQQDPLKIEPPQEPSHLPDVLEMLDAEGEMKPVTPRKEGWPYPIDPDETMAAWGELASLLKATPLFPIEQFAQRMTFMTPLLIDQPGWRELADAVDAAVARASGSAAVAASARTRGIILLHAGRLREALHEMHTAKVEWWTGDTLQGSLLAMIIISDCYEKLRLPQAAKQHALAVAYAAAASGDDDVLELVPAGLLAASEIDYAAGSWCSALELVELGLLAQAGYVDVEASSVASSQWSRALFTVGMCLRAARALVPRFAPFAERVAEQAGMLEGLNEVEERVPPLDRDSFLQQVDEQLLGRPLNDAGATRVFRFAALGTDWTVTSSNRFAEVRAAERFAAAVQIALVELAEDDLCLVPTAIRVRVELAEEGEAREDRILWAASNEGRDWLVRLTPYDGEHPLDLQEIFLELLTLVSEIVIDASLLPRDRYFIAIEKAFRRGVQHKLTSVRAYDELGIPRNVYDRTPRALISPPTDPVEYPAQEHEELAWSTEPGPTYDRDLALQAIRDRYTRSTELIPRTLARLAEDQQFLHLVAELRNRGWRDWHVLQALMNAALNDKLEREGLNTYGQLEESQRRTRELLDSGDLEEDPERPLGPFSSDDLDFHRRNAIPVMLHGWDLELHQQTPDFVAIERFLGERYRYWSDDVSHDDLFPLASDLRATAAP
jgi:hypothetical protein